ncbi:hypothetical protein ARMGADRAFT_529196 [Armillaria gallica]|uniref:Uncharacterized protein n=1 Tax=Armillaria gallica TaxID=47427 RepID=A0A2H3DBN2_ARMGA|nr:hypothetical protein ARMGADRAFT_529196 [Armillaria gallica]
MFPIYHSGLCFVGGNLRVNLFAPNHSWVISFESPPPWHLYTKCDQRGINWAQAHRCHWMGIRKEMQAWESDAPCTNIEIPRQRMTTINPVNLR